jgi:hypothetical protein
MSHVATPVLGQVIQLEAWIAIGFFVALFSMFVVVPLFVLITQSPRLLRDRRYGLFGIVTFTWTFSLFTLGWVVVPMIVAIWFPYPSH